MTADLHPKALEGLLPSRLVMAVGFGSSTPDQQPSAPRWWMTRAWSRGPHRGYPDYESLWPQFAGDLGALTDDGADTGRPAPSPTECELVYVNPITPVEPWGAQNRVERMLLRWFGDHDTAGLLPPPATSPPTPASPCRPLVTPRPAG